MTRSIRVKDPKNYLAEPARTFVRRWPRRLGPCTSRGRRSQGADVVNTDGAYRRCRRRCRTTARGSDDFDCNTPEDAQAQRSLATDRVWRSARDCCRICRRLQSPHFPDRRQNCLERSRCGGSRGCRCGRQNSSRWYIRNAKWVPAAPAQRPVLRRRTPVKLRLSSQFLI